MRQEADYDKQNSPETLLEADTAVFSSSSEVEHRRLVRGHERPI